MKIILLSHGSLSIEMKKTAHMILGDFTDVECLELDSDADIVSYEESIRRLLDSNDENLILCDLLGGTPYLTSLKIYNSIDYKSNVKIITGMNLPMLIESISNKDNYNLIELALMTKKAGSEGVVDIISKIEGGMYK